MAHSGTLCSTDIVLATSEVESVQVGNFIDCDCEDFFTELALVKDGGDDHENDYVSFLFKLVRSSDSIGVELFKGCDNKVDDINDDTFGQFYSVFQSNETFLSGFRIDWLKVQQTHGYGKYYIKVTLSILGQESTIETHEFEVKEYSDLLADGTVKIETIQNGKIINGLDFTGIDWVNSIRVPGFFGKKEYEFETDNYIDSNRTIKQIQDKTYRTYSLVMNSAMNWANNIFEREILANNIFLTDYNLENYEVYRKVEVYPDSIEKQDHKITRKDYEIKFREKSEGRIKRNYF